MGLTVATAAVLHDWHCAGCTRRRTTVATNCPSQSHLAVQPIRLKALLFSNVLEDGSPDPLVVHRAAPVSGSLRKYGMNIWVTDQDLVPLALANEGVVLDPGREKVKESMCRGVLSALMLCEEEIGGTVGSAVPPRRQRASGKQNTDEEAGRFKEAAHASETRTATVAKEPVKEPVFRKRQRHKDEKRTTVSGQAGEDSQKKQRRDHPRSVLR